MTQALPAPPWRAAVVPVPPLLEPAISGAAPGLAGLRDACAAAVTGLVSDEAGRRPRVLVCVGVGRHTRRHDPHAWGTLAGYGVAIDGPTRHAATAPTLPSSLTLGLRLLDRAGWRAPVLLQEVAVDASAAECLSVGVDLPTADTAWLVLGDGTAARTPKAPLSLDPRAENFDGAAARALIAGRPSGLFELDPGLAAELGAAGRAVWQVLAAAATPSRHIDTELLYDDAPYGVDYLVARWWMR